MALRVMSGIRVPVISQIVSLAIKKGCTDMSPHSRKAAALAIPKCYKLDPGTQPQLLDYISMLLGDKQYYVVGSAVSAFLEICPERLDLIHKHFRGLTRKLVDMDEWGQLAVIKLATYYSRKCFPRRTKTKIDSEFYENETVSFMDEGEVTDALDPDLEMFLTSCKPLLYSRSAAVVVAVARCFLYLAPGSWLDLAIAPLIALLRTPTSMHQVVLYNIVAVGLVRPKALTGHFSQFLVRAADSLEVMRLKLELLTLIFPDADQDVQGLILNELEHFTKSENSELVRESVRAIGRCARSAHTTSKRCMNLLLKQASSPDGILVAEALTVIRHLIQQDSGSHSKTIIRLAKNLDTMTNPDARASIIWLVGEYTNPEPSQNIAPDVLRILLQGFADEEEPAKLQIILLAAKVYLQHLNTDSESKPDVKGNDNNTHDGDPSTRKHPIVILWNYALLLARYDTSYDLRDRARMYKALFESPSSTQIANLVLCAAKPPPSAPSPSEARKGFLLGSASLVVGTDAGLAGLPGYEPLPDWVQAGEEPDPSLRNELSAPAGSTAKSAAQVLDLAMREKTLSSQVSNGLANNKEKSLDDWLAEADNVEETSEEEQEEEGEDESEESTDSDDEETDEDSAEDEEKGTLLPS